uniref:Skp1_POZ domain-containing protein n=1 Tax=Panagrellus redivivus TaxID=6233 RepID=A0A7E4V998_PANRE
MSVPVKTNDGKIFDVDKEILMESRVLFHALDMGLTTDEAIPLQNIDSLTMEHIIKLYSFIENIGEYEPPKFYDEDISPKEKDPSMQFLATLPKQELGEMLLAGRYLDSPRLIDYCIMGVIYATSGMAEAALREYFDVPIKPDSPEESDSDDDMFNPHADEEDSSDNESDEVEFNQDILNFDGAVKATDDEKDRLTVSPEPEWSSTYTRIETKHFQSLSMSNLEEDMPEVSNIRNSRARSEVILTEKPDIWIY